MSLTVAAKKIVLGCFAATWKAAAETMLILKALSLQAGEDRIGVTER